MYHKNVVILRPKCEKLYGYKTTYYDISCRYGIKLQPQREACDR